MPLLPEMHAGIVGDVLYDTVLTKIVKSQMWMKATRTIPDEFVIFCWLPPVGAYQACLKQSEAFLWTEALIENVRLGGWPFRLKVMVPLDPGSIFPTQFGLNNDKRDKKHHANDICYFVNANDFEEAEDEEHIEWNLFEDSFSAVSEEEVDEIDNTAVRATIYKHVVMAIVYILKQQQNSEHAQEHSSLKLRNCGKKFVYARILFSKTWHWICLSTDARRDARAKPTPSINGLPWWNCFCWCMHPLVRAPTQKATDDHDETVIGKTSSKTRIAAAYNVRGARSFSIAFIHSWHLARVFQGISYL